MFELKEIIVENDRVNYSYSTSKEISKFFSKDKFYIESDIDFSNVPLEVLAIPLLGNILPISWFAGFDIKIEKLDKEFFESAEKLKQQFAEYYPIINSKNSQLIVNEIVDLKREISNKSAMLFSGGVDAYTTFLRHYEEKPDLITIKGADIQVDDDKQWSDLLEYYKNEPILNINDKYFIACNLRNFYTFEVDKLISGFGWWGKVQHGIALTTLCSPLAHLNSYEFIYIASSYSRKTNYPFIVWGSMPEIDNKISWGTTNIKHDAETFTRQEKIAIILKRSAEIGINPNLRVCYNEFKTTLNCSVCEKCCRTIFAIMIENENPNNYGFNVSLNIFKHLNNIMNRRFLSDGNLLFWKEIYDRALENEKYFNNDKLEWKENYDHFLNHLNQNIIMGVCGLSNFSKTKLNIINKYPKLFNVYLTIRRKLT